MTAAGKEKLREKKQRKKFNPIRGPKKKQSKGGGELNKQEGDAHLTGVRWVT